MMHYVKEWINVKEIIPASGKEVVLLLDDGTTHIAYLCSCCKKEWRCPVTGSTLLINPVKWKDL